MSEMNNLSFDQLLAQLSQLGQLVRRSPFVFSSRPPKVWTTLSIGAGALQKGRRGVEAGGLAESVGVDAVAAQGLVRVRCGAAWSGYVHPLGGMSRPGYE